MNCKQESPRDAYVVSKRDLHQLLTSHPGAPPTTHSKRTHVGFLTLGVPFGGPNNKDYSILGSILGSPYFGKLPYNEETPLFTVYQEYGNLN